MMQGADPRLDIGEHQLEDAHRGQAGQQDGGGHLHQVSLEGKFLCVSCKVGPAGETADGKQKSREGRGKMEIKTS